VNSPPDPVAPATLPVMLADALRHHQAGRLSEAEAIYRQILATDHHHADALHLLGMIEYQGRRYEDAAQLIEQAIALRPDQAHYHSNLGTVLHSQGKLDEAAACYERALALQPNLSEVHINLGNILLAQGKLDEAVASYELALALKPECAEGHYNVANARQAQGRLDEAVACQERAIALKPDYVDAHNNAGLVLVSLGRMAEAVVHYERALDLNPSHGNAHNNLGIALVALGRAADAICHYERALELNPADAKAHSNLGIALAAQGRAADAIAHYEDALSLDPDFADAHNNLGITLKDQDRTEEAMAHYERALAIDPNHAEALNNVGNIFKERGRFEEAMAHYERAIAIQPSYAEAHYNRSEIKRFNRGDDDMTALEALAIRADLPPSKALYTHFALAKAFDDTGDYTRAFEQMRRGNALKRAQLDYDEGFVLGLFQRISAVFDRSLLERFREAGDPSSVPIFVLGMPRSGSTLIEQILASHPQIHGAGELMHLERTVGALATGNPPVPYPECVPAMDADALRELGRDYLDHLPSVSGNKLRVVDKLPGNFLSIGLIRLILPNARIIHTMRDPMDTCVSCYSRLFTWGLHYTYDLAELGHYCRAYLELMDHWRSVLPPGAMLDVSYEDVVDDLEGQARRLIDYCGLPWDERCIAFHKTDRPVKTASAVQVRQPLSRGSLQRWRKYEAGLGALQEALGERGDPEAHRSPRPLTR
jgi:tetratricopeptide (TPR) repeat protein